MLGTRIWQDGWKAAALHAPISGRGHFDQDKWELFHVDEDRSESERRRPESRQTQGIDRGVGRRAKNNFVLPLDDRTAVEMIAIERPQAGNRPAPAILYYPDLPVPEGVAANIRRRSYKDHHQRGHHPQAQGVIFAHGSRFGGHALFIGTVKLHYVYNFLGIRPEQVFVSPPLAPGETDAGHGVRSGEARRARRIAGYHNAFRQRQGGEHRSDAAQLGVHPGRRGLCVRFDSGDAVSSLYTTPAPSPVAMIRESGDVSGEQFLDLQRGPPPHRDRLTRHPGPSSAAGTASMRPLRAYRGHHGRLDPRHEQRNANAESRTSSSSGATTSASGNLSCLLRDDGYSTPNIDGSPRRACSSPGQPRRTELHRGAGHRSSPGQSVYRLGKVGMPGFDVGLQKEDRKLLKPLGCLTSQFGKVSWPDLNKLFGLSSTVLQ